MVHMRDYTNLQQRPASMSTVEGPFIKLTGDSSSSNVTVS